MLAIVFISKISVCQPQISGPGCVKPGIIYQYDIKSNWDSVGNVQVCVTGGTLAGSDSSCVNVMTLPFVKVVWRDTTVGSVSIVAPSGATILQVHIAENLRAGEIDSVKNFQILDTSIVPEKIGCSVASGGSCTPGYQYQWEQSFDNENWTEMPGMTAPDLEFAQPLQRTTFFRRKVLETQSQTAAVSQLASVYIL